MLTTSIIEMFYVVRTDKVHSSSFIVDEVPTINEATSIVADLVEIDGTGEYLIKETFA